MIVRQITTAFLAGSIKMLSPAVVAQATLALQVRARDPHSHTWTMAQANSQYLPAERVSAVSISEYGILARHETALALPGDLY